jgi:hypothetical protein
MKTKPVLLWTAIAAFLVIFIGLVFLPAILSSNLLKPRILKSVNRHLPGRLQVAEWTFKWFSGITARGIRYDPRAEGFFIEVAEVKGYRGLFQLMVNAGHLGGVEVVEPQVVFYLDDTLQPASSEKSEPRSPAGPPPFSGILKITDGSIRTIRRAAKEKTVIKDLDLLLDISDIKKPITYRLFLTSGDAVGRFSGEGTLTLSADHPLDLRAVQSDARLKITNWELEEVLAILASRSTLPSGKGRLNAELSLQGSSAEALDIKARFSLKRLELWGGPLAADRPRITGIDTQIDGTIHQGVLYLNQLRLQSSLANGSARGSFAGRAQNQFQVSADISLAEVFSQLPRTLKLQEGITLSEGTLAWSASVKSTDLTTAFDTAARIDRFRGVSRGKPIAWNQPISLKARGEKNPQGYRIDNLSLRSAFLNADGRGDLSNMEVTLSADLATALKELKKFVAIKAWTGSGKIFAGLQVNETAAHTSAASLNLDIRNLTLNHHGVTIFPKQDATADMTATLRRGDGSAAEFQQPVVTIQSSMARGKFSASRFRVNADGLLPAADVLSIDGHFNLQQISNLLQNFKRLAKKKRLAGTAHLQASGSMDGQRLVLDRMQVDTRNFLYQDGPHTLRDDRLTLQTSGQLDFQTRSVYLKPMDINGSPGTIRIPELTIADWSDLQKDLKTQAKANLDLAKLTRGYRDFIQLPENTQISGKGTFDLDLDFSSPQTQFLKVDADVSSFQLSTESLPPISEDRVRLWAELRRSPDGTALTIESLRLDATPFSLSAAGKLDQRGSRKMLAASGNINLDLKLLSPYLQKMVDPQITLTGKGDNPFKLKMASGGSHWTDILKQTDFTGAIRADSIDAFGLGISATEIPLRVADESAMAKLAATANGGQLNLQPTIDLREEPYTLSLPPDSTILKDVEITDAVAEKLMSKIHPVFRDSVEAEGHVDLYMQHFSWPLDNRYRDKTAFAGTLRLKGVRVNSTRLLSGLLARVGVRSNEMNFGNLDIDFVARNGRIETSPIRLEIDGYPIELHGSVGFDKSLDYTARLPITPMLVGNNAYPYLEGVTINVPIRGDSAKPDIDEGSLQKATSDLVEQALQKSVERGVQNLFEQLLQKK